MQPPIIAHKIIKTITSAIPSSPNAPAIAAERTNVITVPQPAPKFDIPPPLL